MEHECATRLARLGFTQDGRLWVCKRPDGAEVVVGRRAATGLWRVEIQRPNDWAVLNETACEDEMATLAAEALALTLVRLDPELDRTVLTALLTLVEEEYERLAAASGDPQGFHDVLQGVRGLAVRLGAAVGPYRGGGAPYTPPTEDEVPF